MQTGTYIYTGREVLEQLCRKYDSHFNFYFAKSINELVYSLPVPACLDFRDAIIQSEDQEHMRRMYRKRTILGKEQIKDRLTLQAEWYEKVMVLKFEYPMLVLTKNRTIYERRLRRIRMNKAVDVSSQSSETSLDLSQIQCVDNDPQEPHFQIGAYVGLDQVMDPSALEIPPKTKPYGLRVQTRKNQCRRKHNSFVNKYIKRTNQTVLKEQKQKDILKYLEGDWFTEQEYEQYEKQQRHKFIVSLWGESTVKQSQNLSKGKDSKKSLQDANLIDAAEIQNNDSEDSFWSDQVYDVYEREEVFNKQKRTSKKSMKVEQIDWKGLKDEKGYRDMSQIKEVQSVIKIDDNSHDQLRGEQGSEPKEIKGAMQIQKNGLDGQLHIQNYQKNPNQQQKNIQNIFGRGSLNDWHKYQESISHLICDFDDLDEKRIEKQYKIIQKRRQKENKPTIKLPLKEVKGYLHQYTLSGENFITNPQGENSCQQNLQQRSKKCMLKTLNLESKRQAKKQAGKINEQFNKKNKIKEHICNMSNGENIEVQKLMAIKNKFPRMYQNLKDRNKEQLLQVFSFTAAHKSPIKRDVFDNQSNEIKVRSSKEMRQGNAVFQENRETVEEYGIGNNDSRVRKKEEIRQKAAALLKKTSLNQASVLQVRESHEAGVRNTTF